MYLYNEQHASTTNEVILKGCEILKLMWSETPIGLKQTIIYMFGWYDN